MLISNGEALVRISPENTGGLTSPSMMSFLKRLDATIAAVQVIEPAAQPRALRSAMVEAALNPQNQTLRYCTDDSLAQFLLHAARTGLRIGAELAPVVGRDDAGNVVVIPVEGVRGIVRLLRESGAVREVMSGTVYEVDSFRTGEDGRIQHSPAFKRDRGAVVAYYATARLAAYEWISRVVTPTELDELRAASTQPGHIAWVSYRNRMGEVQALRALGALIPCGPFSRTPEPEAQPTRPMAGLPEDPYGECVEVVTSAVANSESDDADPAHDVRMPDNPQFGDYAARPLRECPTSLILSLYRFIGQRAALQVQYAVVFQAMAVVLHLRGRQQKRAAR